MILNIILYFKNFSIAHYFADNMILSNGLHSARIWLANAHFFLQNHILRAIELKFKCIAKASTVLGMN